MVDLRLRLMGEAIVADRTGTPRCHATSSACLYREVLPSCGARATLLTCRHFPAIIDSHVPLTAEEVARQMRVSRTQDDDARVAAWNTQREKDRAEQNQQDRQVREVKVAQHAQLKDEADEQRRAAKKNKPQLNPFSPTRHVSKWIQPQPAAYALVKLNNFEHVELDYFTARRPLKNIRKTKT
jgi:hypothetical protein